MKREPRLFLNNHRITTLKQLAENFNEQEVLEKWRDGSLKDFLREKDSESLNVLESRDLQGKELIQEIIGSYHLDSDAIKEAEKRFRSKKLKELEEQAECSYRGRKFEDAYRIAEDIEKGYPSQSAVAKRILGLCYLNGNGVDKNPGMAKQFLEQAADKEDAEALVALGRIYLNGLGMVLLKDEKQAIEYFLRAEAQGNYGGCYDLAVYYDRKQDFKKAEKLYRTAADRMNNPDAMYKLAHIRSEEKYLLTKVERSEWLRKAAKAGHREAKKEWEKAKRNEIWANRILIASSMIIGGAIIWIKGRKS